MIDSKVFSRLVGFLSWLVACVLSTAWVWAAWQSRSPYFLMGREGLFQMWLVIGGIGLLWLVFGKRRGGRWSRVVRLLAVSALLGALLAGSNRWRHDRNRALVASTPAESMPAIGKHLIVGWLGFDETRALAIKGGIAGVVLTRRDFPPESTTADVRRIVDALQSARRDSGLPDLWIATDQEGGMVEKMSPLVPPLPALKGLIENAGAEEVVRIVTEYGDTQGEALAAVGINMNFAPVVDLMPSHGPGKLDFHSRISTRALSPDPTIVVLAGNAYVKAMARHGITAILKHFPGLGSVPADTHHFSARLDTPIAELEKHDWLPFRRISTSTEAGVMLSHVYVTE